MLKALINIWHEVSSSNSIAPGRIPTDNWSYPNLMVEAQNFKISGWNNFSRSIHITEKNSTCSLFCEVSISSIGKSFFFLPALSIISICKSFIVWSSYSRDLLHNLEQMRGVMRVEKTPKLLPIIINSVALTLWQYRLWSFKSRDTKLKRFLPRNQL